MQFLIDKHKHKPLVKEVCCISITKRLYFIISFLNIQVVFIYLSPFPVGNDLRVIPCCFSIEEWHTGRFLQSLYKLRCSYL